MQTSSQLCDCLTELGFTHQGGPTFARGNLSLKLGQHWATFRWLNASTPGGDPLKDQMGVAGPWKPISEGAGYRLVADAHRHALSLDADLDSPDDQTTPLAGLIDWVAQTAVGAGPVSWEPPDREEVESYYGPRKLTVMAGAYVRQGHLELGPERLAVRVPIVTAIPADLAEQRQDWLRAVMIDTQNRFRMVRIGFVAQDAQQQSALSGVWAEIDLTGAPRAVLEPLFTSGLAALQDAVQWSIQSVGFLVDPSIDGSALEVHSGRLEASSRKG